MLIASSGCTFWWSFLRGCSLSQLDGPSAASGSLPIARFGAISTSSRRLLLCWREFGTFGCRSPADLFSEDVLTLEFHRILSSSPSPVFVWWWASGYRLPPFFMSHLKTAGQAAYSESNPGLAKQMNGTKKSANYKIQKSCRFKERTFEPRCNRLDASFQCA